MRGLAFRDFGEVNDALMVSYNFYRDKQILTYLKGVDFGVGMVVTHYSIDISNISDFKLISPYNQVQSGYR